MAENDRFHTKDELLVVQLARGLSIRAAAEGSGCSERTVARRLKDPAFRRRLKEIRVAATERAINSLTDAATDAVDTLRKLLSAESEQVRLAAGKAILDSSLKYREHEWGQRLSEDQALEMAQAVISAVNNVVKDGASRHAIALGVEQILAHSIG